MKLLDALTTRVVRAARDLAERGGLLTREPAGPAGRLVRTERPQRSPRLSDIPLSELSGELLGRIYEGGFDSEATVALGCQLHDALASALDVDVNRMSRQHYLAFGRLPAGWRADLVRLEGATVVDVGCGSINPYGIVFLYLMLGARRGIAVDPDPIQDLRRAVRALAECVAMMVLDPRYLIGDYPIDRTRILEHIASFDLARLRAGDPAGLDATRLVHRQERVGHLSLEDGEADVVLSNSFLEHVEDVDEVVADLARITRAGGVGVHRIDGADHRRYCDAGRGPLDFLTGDHGAGMTGGCNRIRPLDFIAVFERHGFEVMEVAPFEVLAIETDLRSRMVEPFRSLPREVLGVVGAQLVVQRRQERVRGTGASFAVLAAGWERPGPEAVLVAGARLLHERRYEEALDVLQSVPREHPDYALAAVLRGRVRHRLRDFEGAERELQCAVEAPSTRAEGFLYRAWLRLEQGRVADGLSDAEQGSRLTSRGDPREIQFRGVVALLYAREGRHAEAMSVLDELLRREADQAVVHLWRGWAFYMAGKRDQARAAADAALACDPGCVEARQLVDVLEAPGGSPVEGPARHGTTR